MRPARTSSRLQSGQGKGRSETGVVPALLAAVFLLATAGARAADDEPRTASGGDRPEDGPTTETTGPPGPLPDSARLVLDESWTTGKIDPKRWYRLRKQWGAGNHGVVPENVAIEKEVVDGTRRNVLVCRAHGDLYDGPITGQWGRRDRVGGVIVSREHFASGRFEIVMKIGDAAGSGGEADTGTRPLDPRRPAGMVPAIWTYGFRIVRVPEDQADDFLPSQPLYNPFLQQWGKGICFYWSELDFPEFGKGGRYDEAMYNTFLNRQHDNRFFPVPGAADGGWHTYTTEWRTMLEPVDGILDSHVAEQGGFWWVVTKDVPFERYFGQPLRRLGENRYALHAGRSARHWIDGSFIGENTRFVPALAAQLNLGVWLPDWAGPAPWHKSSVSFASIKVWQYDDEGDARGILVDDIEDSFRPDGSLIRPQ